MIKMAICEECKKGIHKHMLIPYDIDASKLSRNEYLDLIDCKNGVNGNDQCICPKWKKVYDKW